MKKVKNMIVNDMKIVKYSWKKDMKWWYDKVNNKKNWNLNIKKIIDIIIMMVIGYKNKIQTWYVMYNDTIINNHI